MNLPPSELIRCPKCGQVEAYTYQMNGWKYIYCDACGFEKQLERPKRLDINITFHGAKAVVTGDRPIKPFCVEWRTI